jgi:hypothetical protein
MRIRMLTAWVLCAMVLARAAEKPLHADRVVVLKKERTLELLNEGKVIKTYKVALGRDPVGPKARQGDHKTPEGEYILDSRNAHSRFHRSLHISYPDSRDRAKARREFHRAATFSSTDCPMGMDGSGLRIAPGTGPMAVSQSPMKRSKKSGRRLLMAHQSRFVREDLVAALRSRV